MRKISYPYTEILDSDEYIGPVLLLQDHLGGFDVENYNPVLWNLNQYRRCGHVIWHQPLSSLIKSLYPNIQIDFSAHQQYLLNLNGFHNYKCHPNGNLQTFLCSFNGADHVSRKLLVAALQRWRWFDSETCSKNFQFTVDKLDGHLADYLDHESHTFHRPLFIGHDSAGFFDRVHSFGHVRFDHAQNIHNLEHKLTQSFLHIVSETMATSYYPFVTEKFLYSVVTRGLFLAYAQPGWHDHVERYYGFRRYTKLFDYRFDTIQNPVERLLELMSMIAKFSILSPDDWRDLYEMEIDTIEYNYDHYFSGRYLDSLKRFVNV